VANKAEPSCECRQTGQRAYTIVDKLLSNKDIYLNSNFIRQYYYETFDVKETNSFRLKNIQRLDILPVLVTP